MQNSPVILITGASGGIGSAAAAECARRGARVAVHFNANQEHAEAVCAALPGTGHAIFECDLTRPDAVKTMSENVTAKMGAIDVLVNNAGISRRLDVADLDYASWQSAWHDILQTNLIGAANLCYCVSRSMINSGGGRIVNVSSRGAFRGEPQMPWYGASKAGMNAMGQSLAVALAPHGVHVFTVAPGFVETPMAARVLKGPQGNDIRSQSPMGRVAQPEEVASTIAFLAFDAPEFLTGGIIDVNGASYLRS